MLLQPKSSRPIQKELENQIVIQKWTQHDSPNNVSPTTQEINMINVKKPINSKRLSSSLPIGISIDTSPAKKINLHSIPTRENKLPTFKKNYTQIMKTAPSLEPKTDICTTSKSTSSLQLSKQTKDLKTNEKEKKASEVRKIIIPVQTLVNSIISKKDVVLKGNDANNSINSVLSDDKKKEVCSHVYSHILENFRYIVTPKSWSVTESTKDNIRYIVFYNTQVLRDNNVLIAVILKSLIIDREGIINYSVHGLPVDTKDTILPKSLDDTKKLLSILHIFDKIYVCLGVGSDLNGRQSDDMIRDNCNYLRHKRCSLILLRKQTCLVCMETRNAILGKRILNKIK